MGEAVMSARKGPAAGPGRGGGGRGGWGGVRRGTAGGGGAIQAVRDAKPEHSLYSAREEAELQSAPTQEVPRPNIVKRKESKWKSPALDKLPLVAMGLAAEPSAISPHHNGLTEDSILSVHDEEVMMKRAQSMQEEN